MKICHSIPVLILLVFRFLCHAHESEASKPFEIIHAHQSFEAHAHTGWESLYFSEGRDALNGKSLWTGSLEVGYDHFSGGVWYGRSSDHQYDEVQYNLHVLLRFDLERALISGDLQPGSLEAAWNDRFLADFGFAVEKPSQGCLQDVHWSEGLFGYFPTYTLGNVYAGCLHEALRDAVPNLDNQLAKGDTTAATTWLRDAVQIHGGLKTPKETIADACGKAPSEGPLLDYLEAKFGAIYGL